MIDGLVQIQIGATVLADGTAEGGICEELSVNGARVIEEAEFIRANWISVFERGNRRNEIEFTISTQHESLIASMHAALTSNDTLAGRADFILKLSEAGTIYTATIAGAGWRSVQPRVIGVSNVTRYAVVGGRVTTTNAPDPGNAIDCNPPFTDDLDGGAGADGANDPVEVIDLNA